MNLNRLRAIDGQFRAQIGVLASLLTALMIAGCGAQNVNPSVDPSGLEGSSGSASRMEILIRNPFDFKRTVMNETSGNPERYAVDGELLESHLALSRLLGGRTICYSKLINYEPTLGAQISASYSNMTKSENGKTLQYLNITRLNETGTSSISFVCMKLTMKVRPEELRAGFGEMLRITIL